MEEMIQSALGAAGTSLDMDLKMEDMSGTLVVDKENRPVSAHGRSERGSCDPGTAGRDGDHSGYDLQRSGKRSSELELPDPEEYQKIEAPAA